MVDSGSIRSVDGALLPWRHGLCLLREVDDKTSHDGLGRTVAAAQAECTVALR